MIIYQSRIYRADLRANPFILYVFGDNVRRVGKGGQAGEMRGEPNAIGIATKWAPGGAPADYFNDAQMDEILAQYYVDIEPVLWALNHGGTIVFPLDGIGTGLSEVPRRAPKVWAMFCEKLAALGIKNGPQS